MASKAYSAPSPSVRACTSGTGSPAAALIVWVAPSRFAISSLASSRSIAIIFSAPERTAPWTTFNPMPPTPNTATLLPGRTRAVFVTAQTPVVTLHPTSAALSRGMSLPMGMADSSAMTVYSPKDDMLAKW